MNTYVIEMLTISIVFLVLMLSSCNAVKPTTAPTLSSIVSFPTSNYIASSKPSIRPTVQPSQPTKVPTILPTQPTEIPTVKPSKTPSLVPSQVPTKTPSLSPIAGIKSKVIVTTSQTLTNVNSAEIDNDDEFYTTFESLILNELFDSNLVVSEVTVTSVSGNVQSGALSYLVNLFHGRPLVVNRATVIYDIVTFLQYTVFDDGSTLSYDIESILASSANSIVASLQASNIVAVQNITSISAPTIIVIYEVNYTDDNRTIQFQSSFKAVYIFIAIGSFGFCGFIIAASRCFNNYRSNKDIIVSQTDSKEI